jgi:hypothetical protein
MKAQSRDFQTALDPSNPLILKNNQNTKYKGFKVFLYNKLKNDSLKQKKNKNIIASKANSLSLIRAVFYTPWNANLALPDLKKMPIKSIQFSLNGFLLIL